MSPWAASSSSLHTAGKRRDPCADTSTNQSRLLYGPLCCWSNIKRQQCKESAVLWITGFACYLCNHMQHKYHRKIHEKMRSLQGSPIFNLLIERMVREKGKGQCHWKWKIQKIDHFHHCSLATNRSWKQMPCDLLFSWVVHNLYNIQQLCKTYLCLPFSFCFTVDINNFSVDLMIEILLKKTHTQNFYVLEIGIMKYSWILGAPLKYGMPVISHKKVVHLLSKHNVAAQKHWLFFIFVFFF